MELLPQQFVWEQSYILNSTSNVTCDMLYTPGSWDYFVCYFYVSYISRMLGATLLPIMCFLFTLIEIPMILLLFLRTTKFPLVVHDFFALYTTAFFAPILNLIVTSSRILNVIPVMPGAGIAGNAIVSFYIFLLPAYAMPIIIKLCRIGINFIIHKMKVKSDRQSLSHSNQKKASKKTQMEENIDEVLEFQRKKKYAATIKFLNLWMLRVTPAVVLLVVAVITILLSLLCVALTAASLQGIGYVINVILAIEAFFIVIFVLASLIFVCVVRVSEPFGIIGLTSFSLVAKIVAGVLYLLSIIFDSLTFFFQESSYVSTILLFFMIIVLNVDVIVTVMVPVIQTFVWNRNKHGDEKNVESVQYLLKDKEGYSLFYTFAANEWAAENLSYWSAYSQYTSIKDESKKLEKAQELYSLYIDINGPFAVNIDSRTLKEAKEAMQDPARVDEALYKVMREVESVMCDTFARFMNTHQYADWKIAKRAEEETKKELNWDKESAQQNTVVRALSKGASFFRKSTNNIKNIATNNSSSGNLKSAEAQSQYGQLVESGPNTPKVLSKLRTISAAVPLASNNSNQNLSSNDISPNPASSSIPLIEGSRVIQEMDELVTPCSPIIEEEATPSTPAEDL